MIGVAKLLPNSYNATRGSEKRRKCTHQLTFLILKNNISRPKIGLTEQPY